MKTTCLIILFCCLFKSYDGYTLPTNVIVAIMEELSIINPTILHDNKTVYCSQQIKFIKELSKFGHSISYNVDDNKYSIIEFVKLNDLQWKYFCENCIVYAPLTLIVTQIQSESDLDQVNLRIDNEIYFIDEVSLKLYETYYINKIHTTNYLGKIQIIGDNSTSSIEKPIFVKSDKYISSVEKRRTNFQGIQLHGMVADQRPSINFPKDFTSKVNYFSKNQTYDMTNVVDGVYINVLHSLESLLNFSTKLYLRKDEKWGIPKVLQNGTVMLDGMIKSIVEEHPVDFIWTCLSVLPARTPYVDYLPALTHEYGGIFIPKQSSMEEVQYYLFLEPLTLKLWVTILITDLCIVGFIFIIQWFYSWPNMVRHNGMVKNLTSMEASR